MKKPFVVSLTAAMLAIVGLLAGSHVVALNAQRGPNPTIRQIHSLNSFLYIEASGLNEVRDAWEQTAMYDAVVKSGLYELLDKMLVFAEQQDESGIVSQLNDGLDQIVREGISLSASVDPEGPIPIPYAVVVLHGMRKWQSEIEQLAEKIAEEADLEFTRETAEDVRFLKTIIPNSPGIEIGIIGLGEHVAIVAGFDACNQTILTATQPNLSINNNAKWAGESARPAEYAVETRVWFDFEPLKTLYSGIEVPIKDEKSISIGEILSVARLDQFDSCYMQQGYDGMSVRCESQVHYPNPAAEPQKYEFRFDDLPALPSDLTFLHACTFDAVAMYDDLLSIFNEALSLAEGDDIDQIREFLDNLNEKAGFNIRNELLSAIGSMCLFYTEPDTGAFGMNITAAVELKNPEQMQKFLKLMMERFYDLDDDGLTEDWPIIPIESKKNEGKMIVFEIGGYDDPYQYGAVQVVENWLVISLLPQSIDTFQLALDREIPTFELDKTSRGLLARLPQKYCSFSFVDTKSYVSTSYGMLTLFAPFIQKAAMEEIDLEEEEDLPFYVEDLPPTKLITRKLFPNISVSTYNQDGMQSYSFQSMPGFPMVLSSNANPAGGVAAVAVGSALLLPAIQQAREAARGAQGKNQLKQIGLGLHNYADTFKEFPSSSSNAENPSQGLSWMVKILPFIEQQSLYNEINDVDSQEWGNEQLDPIVRTLVPIFVHPSEPWPNDLDDYPVTNYAGVAGVGEEGPTLPVSHPKAGMFGYGRSTKYADVKDGLSNTFMVGTVNFNNGPWARGGDATIRAFTQKPYINGDDGFGFPGYGKGYVTMLMGDGAVRDVSETVSDEIIEAAATLNGGEVIDWTDF